MNRSIARQLADHPIGPAVLSALPDAELAQTGEFAQAALINLAAIHHAESNMREARRAVALGDLQRAVIAQARADRIDPEMPLRALRAEVALELQLSERAVANLCDLGYQLNALPDLQETWLNGLISAAHVRLIADSVTTLRMAHDTDLSEPDSRVVEEVVAKLTEYALHNAPHRLRAKARSLVETAQRETAIERHMEAVKQRCVTLAPSEDGMAWVSALLAAPEAAGIYDRTRQIAQSLKQHEAEKRNLGQLQADVLTDLLIHGTTAAPPASQQTAADATITVTSKTTLACGAPQSTPAAQSGAAAQQDTATQPCPGEFPLLNVPGIGTGIRANVNIIVPAFALLSFPTQALPGVAPDLPESHQALPELEGYGPIDVETARRLAGASNRWWRILTHPATGVRLVYDRETYRPPEELRNYAKQQDGHCRFPGCSRPAKNCELDHVIDWQWDGPTNAENLASLCRSHHVLKHNSNWQVKHVGNRILIWTSPNGATHTTMPRFADPPGFTTPDPTGSDPPDLTASPQPPF